MRIYTNEYDIHFAVYNQGQRVFQILSEMGALLPVSGMYSRELPLLFSYIMLQRQHSVQKYLRKFLWLGMLLYEVHIEAFPPHRRLLYSQRTACVLRTAIIICLNQVNRGVSQ